MGLIMTNKKCVFSHLTGNVYFSAFKQIKGSNAVQLTGAKVDVTNSAVQSVAEKLLTQNVTFEFSANGKRYAMSVVEIEG